jgi:hypothetical protein
MVDDGNARRRQAVEVRWSHLDRATLDLHAEGERPIVDPIDRLNRCLDDAEIIESILRNRPDRRAATEARGVVGIEV